MKSVPVKIQWHQTATTAIGQCAKKDSISAVPHVTCQHVLAIPTWYIPREGFLSVFHAQLGITAQAATFLRSARSTPPPLQMQMMSRSCLYPNLARRKNWTVRNAPMLRMPAWTGIGALRCTLMYAITKCSRGAITVVWQQMERKT